MRRGPYNRRTDNRIATLSVHVVAKLGWPFPYSMDGQCFEFFPIVPPHIEDFPVFQSRRAA